MAENSKIEWCDHTFNPWVGCTKISPACDHCYAEGWAKRAGSPELWQGHRRRTSEANWREPMKWNRQAEREGRRFKVFCASLADVFDNQVPADWRADLWALIAGTPSLDWLLLTKRPQNIGKMLPGTYVEQLVGRDLPPWPWPNVWLGTTVENQIEAERRVPHLLSVPAAVRFLSCEPMQGLVDLTGICTGWYFIDALRGLKYHDAPEDVHAATETCGSIHWVICGGESGPGARPMHPDWARSLRDQCADAGVPFCFKQWGEWTPGENVERTTGIVRTADWFGDHWSYSQEDLANEEGHIDDEPDLYRVGKKAAGALLDGREHRDMPS